jgi:hypothetical protein
LATFLTVIWRSTPHLANEDPNQPETESEKHHDTVTDKTPEAITLPVNNINDHFHLLKKNIERLPQP